MHDNHGAQQIRRQKRADMVLAIMLGTICAVTISATIVAIGLFFNPLREELDWSSQEVSYLAFAFFLAGGLAMLPNGWLLDRLGGRAIVLVNIVLGALGLLLASIGHSLEVLIAGFALAGIGITGCSIAPATFIASRHMHHMSLAMAMGILMCMCAVIGGLVPIGLEAVIDRAGWRMGLQVYAIGMLAIVILLTLFFIPRHNTMVVPFAPTDAESSTRLPVLKLSLLMAMQFLFNICMMGFTIHFVPFAMDRGFTSATAILLMGVLGLVLIPGALLIGWSAGRIKARSLLMGFIVLEAIGFLALYFPTPQWAPLLPLIVFVIGVGLGSSAVGQLTPVLISEIVPPSRLGFGFGISAFSSSLANAIGPVAAGFIVDTSNGYAALLLAAGGGTLLSLVPLLLLYVCGNSGKHASHTNTVLQHNAA